MVKSLRSKLLLWYTAIVALLAVAFAGILYVSVRNALAREIDSLLQEHASDLATAITTSPDGKFYIELRPNQVELFRDERAGAPHYSIWSQSGEMVDNSHPDLEIPLPAELGSRDWGPYRQVAIAGPAGSRILVGRNALLERQHLHGLLTMLLAISAGILSLAVVGGWFLTGRALQPIDRISEAAAAVSESNLSERIDPARMESELVELTQTINAMFDRLESAFDRQTRFTADASHELRTPLSIILSQADLTLKRPREAAEYERAMEVVRRAARRMTAIVEGLLTLARADAQRIELTKTPVNLCQLVMETVADLKPLADEKQIAVQLDLENVFVTGDADRLSDAVANLLNNAIRYNVEGGTVSVTLRGEDLFAILTIADSGQGISLEDQAFVFERFFRADKSRQRSAGGTGLGLAITKWIVEAHDGEISFTSRPGQGTSFTLRLRSVQKSNV